MGKSAKSRRWWGGAVGGYVLLDYRTDTNRWMIGPRSVSVCLFQLQTKNEGR